MIEKLMAKTEKLIERSRVVMTAAVTWLTIAGTIAAVLVDELAGFPGAAEFGARAGIVIATAISIIRRVTPVPLAERGIL